MTGHTLSVAKRLQEALSAGGHQVTLAGLHEGLGSKLVHEPAAALAGCDALVFCSPVQGGLSAPEMKAYLESLPPLPGVTAACLVTGFFPAAWGRN